MITILQHGRGEPPALILDILQEKGEPYECIPLYETNEVSAPSSSCFILLGGQMSANDEKEYPFLKQEKKLIRSCVSSGKPLLGVCLGAQLIASAFRKSVYSGTREVGWTAVHRTASHTLPTVPKTCMVFQWHSETFDLPEGAHLFYRGDAIENQAFTLGSAIGVQFHMEMTADLIQRWVRALKPEEQKRILGETERYLPQNQDLCRRLLDVVIRRV